MKEMTEIKKNINAFKTYQFKMLNKIRMKKIFKRAKKEQELYSSYCSRTFFALSSFIINTTAFNTSGKKH